MSLSRRTLVGFVARAAVSGAASQVLFCSRGGGSPLQRDQRCQRCGMRIDGSGPWQAEVQREGLDPLRFDTPQCAIHEYAKRPVGRLRVREYYSRLWVDSDSVGFVKGSDVSGPMGPEFVPVDPKYVQQFLKDHGGEGPWPLARVVESMAASSP